MNVAVNRSDDSKWPSRYSPAAWVTAAQYIIELVCERQAAKNKVDLPLQFWNLPEWSKEFASQTRATNRLLKKYDAKAIINAIKMKGIWSLRPKWVEQVINKEQAILEKTKIRPQSTEPKELERPIIENKRAPRVSSKLQALLDIDEA